MRVVIQRASEASVTIDDRETRGIDQGLVILLGIEDADSQEDIDWLTRKIASLRVFNDDEGKMNYSIQDVKGEFLVISQFTLHASVKKGTRPSYVKAAKPDVAIPLYDSFIETLKKQNAGEVISGEFGADMKVSLVNDGPVTIVIDTKNKE